jgi:hypothetical protein
MSNVAKLLFTFVFGNLNQLKVPTFEPADTSFDFRRTTKKTNLWRPRMRNYDDTALSLNVRQNVIDRFGRGDSRITGAGDYQPTNELLSTPLRESRRKDSKEMQSFVRRDLDAGQNGQRATSSLRRRENPLVIVEGLMVGNRKNVDARPSSRRHHFDGVISFAVDVQIDFVPAATDRAVIREML